MNKNELLTFLVEAGVEVRAGKVNKKDALNALAGLPEDVDQALGKAFQDASYSDSDIYDVAADIDMEDMDHEELGQYSRSELIEVITGWVERGIERGDWTLKGWIADVIEPKN